MGNRIYVGNLSYNTTQDSLRQSFSKSGTVTDVKIIMDRMTGQSRGFGFVSFENDGQASQAIQDWNGQDLDGRNLMVNEAQDRRPSPNNYGGPPSNGGGQFRENNPSPDNGGQPFGGSFSDRPEFKQGQKVYKNFGADKPPGGTKFRPPRRNDNRGRRPRQEYDE